MAYVGLLQIGLGQGTIRMIAFHAARGEIGVVRRIVSYGVVWHLVAAVASTRSRSWSLSSSFPTSTSPTSFSTLRETSSC